VQLAELITNPSATPKVPRGATSPNLSPVELRKSGVLDSMAFHAGLQFTSGKGREACFSVGKKQWRWNVKGQRIQD